MKNINFKFLNFVFLVCPNAKYVLQIHDDVVPYIEGIVKGPTNPPPENGGFQLLQCGKRVGRPQMNDDFTEMLSKDERDAKKFNRQQLPSTCLSSVSFYHAFKNLKFSTIKIF